MLQLEQVLEAYMDYFAEQAKSEEEFAQWVHQMLASIKPRSVSQ